MYFGIEEILKHHYPDIQSSVVREVVRAGTETNAFLKHTSTGGSLSTSRRKESFFAKEFAVVEPAEFVNKHSQTLLLFHHVQQ